MDETCIMYNTLPNHIILPKGTNNCAVKTSKYEKDKVTVVLLIRADGQKYEPMIIFKGTPGGRIENKEC